MDALKEIESSCMNEDVRLLEQILQLYRALGPQSMESLTKSNLAPAPTSETAKYAAEAAMAQAFSIFDEAANSSLRAFAKQQGYDLSESIKYQRRRDEGYFRVLYPVIVI